MSEQRMATVLPKPTDRISPVENCPVASVVERDGVPCGVQLVDGRFVPASRVGNFDELV